MNIRCRTVYMSYNLHWRNISILNVFFFSFWGGVQMARSHWSDDSMGCSRFLGSIKFLHSQFLYWCISHITAINWKYQLFLSLGMRIITLYLLCLFWHYYVLLKKPLHPRPQQGGGGGCINISTSWRAGKRREESHSHTVNSRCNARAFLLVKDRIKSLNRVGPFCLIRTDDVIILIVEL